MKKIFIVLSFLLFSNLILSKDIIVSSLSFSDKEKEYIINNIDYVENIIINFDKKKKKEFYKLDNLTYKIQMLNIESILLLKEDGSIDEKEFSYFTKKVGLLNSAKNLDINSKLALAKVNLELLKIVTDPSYY